VVEMIKIEVEVPKEVHEIGVALAAILKTTAQALEDGFQVTDIATIIGGSVESLIPAIKDIQNVGEEFKKMPTAATMGALIPVSEGIQALIDMKKK
jgi:hypothetical protein